MSEKLKNLKTDGQCQAAASELKLEWICVEKDLPIDTDLLTFFPHSLLKKAILPICKRQDGVCELLIADPLDIQSIELARFLLKRPVLLKVAPRSFILKKLDRFLGQSIGKIGETIQSASDKNGLIGTQEKTSPTPTEASSCLNLGDQRGVADEFYEILRQAIAQRASDIHFEPHSDQWRVRFRIDGILQKRGWHSTQTQMKLNTRIKALAGLDIAEKRRSQDGRLEVHFEGKKVDIRISSISVAGGERIVLRLLYQDSLHLKLRSLSLPRKIERALKKELSRSQGLLLVCGPTGCGKTTTIFSALSEIQDDEKNIMTIEDPVEYRLSGISQMQVQPLLGIDFAKGLHHLMRQDPDVLLLGEMRDKDAAQIAFRAALTGHLVLSTLHAKSAMGALTRLVEMGLKPQVIMECLNGILFQRLVRRRCPHCKDLKSNAHNRREDRFEEPHGCEQCNLTGYLGRQGVYEWLPIQQPMLNFRFDNSKRNFENLISNLGKDCCELISLNDHVKQLVDENNCCQEELSRLL